MQAKLRKILLLVTDILFINLSFYLAIFIRFEFAMPQKYYDLFLNSVVFITVIQIVVFYLLGLYRSLWEYASIEELMQIFIATLSVSGLILVTGMLLGDRMPYSVCIISCVLMFMFAGFSRISYRYFRRLKMMRLKLGGNATRVMIVGAGSAGSMLIKELKNNSGMNALPIVVVDDDKSKQRTRINGVPVVLGRERIKELSKKYEIDEIIVAIPSAAKKDLADILRICKSTKCRLKTLPGVMGLAGGHASVNQLRDVNIEDLLGRDEIALDIDEISDYLKDETVLVTGGGGSIGSELCRQIARFKPKKLIVFDIYENNAYDLQNELLYTYKDSLDLEVLIGSCRDRERLREIFEKYRPGVVFHAAAHKHVPLMEGSPAEAIKNNVFGTLNTARRADDFGAKKFILVSTDKAVNPTNIMGASKRLAEIIIQSMNRMSKTKFAAVRFGNVLGSNGSVIPLFQKQIAKGGPVTVTDKEIIRYFMTIPEAAQLVIQAGALAKGGEVFVLDMGDPVKIDDLARDLIRLSGYEPDVDMKIEYTGLRPGEKLYEELLMAEEGLERTAHKKIFIGKQSDMSFKEVIMYIKALENSMESEETLRECMAKLVPTYQYKNYVKPTFTVAEEQNARKKASRTSGLKPEDSRKIKAYPQGNASIQGNANK
ncbi:MAG TPA: nucleoside-diphosphate sugar epimerase/dehydratase [Clostridia bacterium]|nr:nucleoside-diphosphate sugar epimerase/dehydratase [Clostridia bacterium]